jgi:hypothetical protein
MTELNRIEIYLFDNMDEELNVLAKAKTNTKKKDLLGMMDLGKNMMAIPLFDQFK